MDRSELIEITKRAVAEWWLSPEGQAASVGEAAAVVDANESLIRAERANLRAKVAALDGFVRETDEVEYVRLNDVLDLLDGEPGGQESR